MVQLDNPKNKKAVALKYNNDLNAPKVVAKGEGYVADKIIQTATENNVSIIKDDALIQELAKIDLGFEIPPHLYEAVAQILIFISDIEKKAEMNKNVK